MGVAVDEPGNGHHAGAVDDGFRRLLGSLLVDGDNFPALNADVSAENDLHFRIHGHRGDICDQSIQAFGHPFVDSICRSKYILFYWK